jgi:CRISPR/Cas system CSM-associated protein Csm3 (group 7 of RAMP superfamily)
MSIPLPFTQGVTSLLKCVWTFELKTPLVIRASTSASIRNNEGGKGRKKTSDLRWEDTSGQTDSNWSLVKDFNYEFYLEEVDSLEGRKNVLKVRYSIPGSSIRGALRQWTIHALVQEEEKRLFSLPKRGSEITIPKSERMISARKAVEDYQNHWHDILSLFGIAFDLNPGVDEPLVWSGRIDMSPINFLDNTGITEGYQYEQSSVNRCAPLSSKSHIKTRSPLDRVTMAARSHGLHSCIEMSEGQRFFLEFRILNPKPNDLRILKIWKRDLNAGFIRFGGLTTQGRGKVRIGSETYTLFAACNSPLAASIRKFEKPDIVEPDMLFSDLWTGAELDFECLMHEDIMASLNV